MNKKGSARHLLLGVLFCFSTVPGFLYAQSLRVVINSVPEKIEYIRSIARRGDFNGDFYVSAEQFAAVLNISAHREESLGKFVLFLDGSRVTLTAENPFVMVGEKLYQMPLVVREFRSELYFPVQSLFALLDNHLPGDYKFDPENKTLTINVGSALNITGMSVEEKANGTLARIETTRSFGEGLNFWFDETKYNLTVEFYNGRLDTVQMSSTETRGLILRSTAVQHPQIASITFRLSRYVEDYSVIQDPHTLEVLVSLTNRKAVIPPPDSGYIDVNEIVARDRESWKIDTIVIDPGHGGKDPGTMAENLREKDIVLDIAHDLGNLLRSANLVENVILTRDSDIFVPLKKRTDIANTSGGKLFVSIHVNSNKNSRLRGFETYFLRPGKNQDALEVLEVVQRENNVMNLYENKAPDRELSDEDKMILSITQSAFAKESERLANFISESIGRKVSWPNLGVKQAGFLVLWGVSMPNVLVEAGFITNAGQRKDLRTSVARHRVAEGIYEGIKKFIEQVR